MDDTTRSLARPLALVTGASSGIGRELARELAERGYDLIVVAEDDAIHEVARELDAITAARAVQADLATTAGNLATLAALDDDPRRPAAAAINAGVGVGGPLVDTDLDDHLRLVAVNVTSTVHLGKAVAERMVAEGDGRLLFTSSIASQMPGPLNTTYAASKSFVQSFAEGLRQELRDSGVTVTALMPGPTDTDFFDRADLEGTHLDEGHKDGAEQVARQGVDAMLEGRDHVVTGTRLNAIQAALSSLLPDPLKAKLHGKMNSPT
ncbi:SDR family NAD(P)-dependent oxidoreductase [Aeromicrobium sp. SMF47]|uniref:SDR family NAD(P)-dependent oxidoreductase n=1 Tax=Aeromicrobium yanjiei TaxID=2662028 RepID=A0A5Q2MK07_9ACTN|nr:MULTISPECIES: SDR family NAD(P)-dependent oxidoreductase [Aeromicrobium]MRJ75258.1 SDR family NAD(P)-dependent oxidoreductase [Aeromicrobium yanjiei]MRK02684.1 SDR family NAD(P)-dependent oxidoreductase [Aeromicrobium sp. S22]QGG40280.1 SDR family NAD(P)-dependent oxidoreductase [Aeromicrobium yanjiei]